MLMVGRDEGGNRWAIRCAAGSLRWKWPMESRQSRTTHNDTPVLALYNISVAFWQAQLPHDEQIVMHPPRGEEEAGYMADETSDEWDTKCITSFSRST